MALFNAQRRAVTGDGGFEISSGLSYKRLLKSELAQRSKGFSEQAEPTFGFWLPTFLEPMDQVSGYLRFKQRRFGGLRAIGMGLEIRPQSFDKDTRNLDGALQLKLFHDNAETHISFG